MYIYCCVYTVVGYSPSPAPTSGPSGEDEDEDFVDQPVFIVIVVLGGLGVILTVAIAVIIITVVSRHHINNNNNKRREHHTGITDCVYMHMYSVVASSDTILFVIRFENHSFRSSYVTAYCHLTAL